MISFFTSLLLKRIFSGKTVLWKTMIESISIVFTVAVVYYASESFAVKAEAGSIESGSLFIFLIVGEIALLLSMSFSERLLAHFLEIRHQHFYQTLLGLRISPNQFIFSKALVDLIFPFLRVVFFLGFGAFFMNLQLSFSRLVAFSLLQILAILVFALMALITSLIYLKYNKGIGFFYTLQSFAAIAGGMYFPTNVFPAYFKNISLYLPQTQILSASRLIFQGQTIASYSMLILLVWFFSLLVVWFILNKILLHYLKKNARFF